MKICDEVKENKRPVLIQGNLYERKDGAIYICAYEDRLIRLDNGCGWDGDNGFGGDDYEFTDVTDQYCLKKISE